MSRKSKLILATAVFGAALFGASCGGGGEAAAGTGNGSTGNGSNGGGTQPPPASVEGKVLALLEVNASKRVSICELKNNTKAECGNDISSGANATLSYIHEFGNGNVLLHASNKLYFFDGNQVKKLTTYRGLGLADETTTSAGIDALTGSGVKWHATKNFVIMVDNTGTTKHLVVITSSGKVIKDSGNSNYIPDPSCEAVEKGTTDYKLNVDGSSATTTIPTFRASAGGKYLVQHPNNNRIYLSDSECSATGVFVDIIPSTDDAKMVVDGNGNFYIAVKYQDSSNYPVKYYKVSGNTASEITLSPRYNATSSEYSYALDGQGRLYVVNASAPRVVFLYHTNGTMLGNASAAPANYTEVLGFKDRVLGRDDASTPKVYEIRYNGTAVVSSTVDSISHEPLTRCTDANTIDIDGVGTNFIRCAYDGGSGNRFLYSLKYSDGTYLIAYKDFSSAINSVDFVAGKALVNSNNYPLCTTTDAPSISCENTNAPAFDRTLLRDGNDNKYLKSDGRNNVLYTSGGVVKAGDIFGPPTDVLIPATGISGGSASFDVTKFAYIPGLGSCLTSIAYLSSTTASPKFYTIEQPSNACLKGILKVFSTP